MGKGSRVYYPCIMAARKKPWTGLALIYLENGSIFFNKDLGYWPFKAVMLVSFTTCSLSQRWNACNEAECLMTMTEKELLLAHWIVPTS